MSTLGLVDPLGVLAAETATFELFRFSRAWISSVVRVLERVGRNGAGEPAREVRNLDRWLVTPVWVGFGWCIGRRIDEGG